jgi:arylsulfatase A
MPEKLEGMKTALLKVWKNIEAEGPKDWWLNERQKPMKGATLNY